MQDRIGKNAHLAKLQNAQKGSALHTFSPLPLCYFLAPNHHVPLILPTLHAPLIQT